MHNNHPSTAAIQQARRLMAKTGSCRKPYVVAFSLRSKSLRAYTSIEQYQIDLLWITPSEHWRLLGTYLKPSVFDLAYDIDCFTVEELEPRNLL